MGPLKSALNSPCVPTGSFTTPRSPCLVTSSAGLNHRTSRVWWNMCFTTATFLRTRMGMPVRIAFLSTMRSGSMADRLPVARSCQPPEGRALKTSSGQAVRVMGPKQLATEKLPFCRKRENLCLSQFRLASLNRGRARNDRNPVWKSSRSLERTTCSQALSAARDCERSSLEQLNCSTLSLFSWGSSANTLRCPHASSRARKASRDSPSISRHTPWPDWMWSGYPDTEKPSWESSPGPFAPVSMSPSSSSSSRSSTAIALSSSPCFPWPGVFGLSFPRPRACIS
mmetsp:Transcript_26022/g.35872  ORF Transcript_26022/g.35872 Transcript_26022/m.35872 type:complete len:284 (-) Transcript_26022:297-1148(-)